nr:hypothetical protein [uncultured Clostridium sp.]
MKYNQNFPADSLSKLESLFHPEPARRNNTLRYGKNSIKWLCIVIAVLYFCIASLYLLDHKFTFFTTVCAYTAVAATIYTMFIVWFGTWNKKRIQEAVIKKYGREFMVDLEKDHMVYKEVSYNCKDIDYMVFYDEFVFIYAGNTILVIYKDDGILEALNKIIDENKNIKKIIKTEPFRLDGYVNKGKRYKM